MTELEKVIFKRNGQEKKEKPSNISEPTQDINGNGGVVYSLHYNSKTVKMEGSVLTSKTMEHGVTIHHCRIIDTAGESDEVTPL